MQEPIKRLPKLSNASKSGDRKPILGIFVLAVVGAATTAGLLKLLPYLLR